MQHALSCPPLGAAESGSNPAFNVLIAYEDFETGKHAKRTYDFLVEQLGRECQFSNQMWKFDVLRLPKLQGMAAADAREADIVVISCSGRELPAHVKSWIESWLNGAEGPIALVALFHSAPEASSQASAARQYLSDAARRGNMDFFAQPDEWPGRLRESAELTFGADLGQRALSTLAGVIQTELPASRWSPFD